VFASLGIRKIKLTGGEPLMRKGIPELVGKLKAIKGIEQVTLTTNGLALSPLIEDLEKAGLDGVNLSMDTLNPEAYVRITRGQSFDQAMEGFHAVLCRSGIPLKINCVPMGMEGQEVEALAELARKYPVHVRYIEMMPIGLGRRFRPQNEDEILDCLRKKYGNCVLYHGVLGNGPGHYYSFEGFQGKIGFISALSHKFCGSCNRIRLTSKGYLKTCLQYETGADLRVLLRGGASDEAIREAIQNAVLQKPDSHHFTGTSDQPCDFHMMSQIGG
ncbi:MAG: radical SAM protein, partial [Candidatus Choladocola sp.]|nr:radical SAM protein [Candidatus Choladocola sp.]